MGSSPLVRRFSHQAALGSPVPATWLSASATLPGSKLSDPFRLGAASEKRFPQWDLWEFPVIIKQFPARNRISEIGQHRAALGVPDRLTASVIDRAFKGSRGLAGAAAGLLVRMRALAARKPAVADAGGCRRSASFWRMVCRQRGLPDKPDAGTGKRQRKWAAAGTAASDGSLPC